jgi:hypothetical protein
MMGLACRTMTSSSQVHSCYDDDHHHSSIMMMIIIIITGIIIRLCNYCDDLMI